MFRDLRRRLGDAAEAALPARELIKRTRESCGIEIRPQAVNEVQFGIGAHPQQKIAQAALATAADQQIHLGGSWLGVVGLRKEGKVLGGYLRRRGVAQPAPGLDRGGYVAAGVVDGEAQVQPPALRSHAFAVLDLPEQPLT